MEALLEMTTHSLPALQIWPLTSPPLLTRIATAKHFHGSGHLLLTDSLIFLFLCGSFEPLPREVPQVEVHHHVTQRLQIITTALLYGGSEEGRGWEGGRGEGGGRERGKQNNYQSH